MTLRHALGYILVVAITYLVDTALERIGYRPPEPLGRLIRVGPGLLVLFMPVTPFLFFLVGSYYDLREYVDARQQRRRLLLTNPGLTRRDDHGQ